MEFKQLEIKPEGNWIKRKLWAPQTRKTILYIAIGALAGIAYFYFTEGKHMIGITPGDVLKSMLIGGLFGLFISNSPCSRGQC